MSFEAGAGPPNALELWGGIECTHNRVRDRYFDQLAWSGHRERIADLDAIAALGITRLRYPVLWEHAFREHDSYDWNWADMRLERLRALRVDPIVGFLHHGSGPLHTSLLDPELPKGVGDFAAAFARRFPWVEAYTPVNEPLTTARFSALYGHWYPHAADDRSFVRALLNQCLAVKAAMRAVRRVRSDAKLIQTEDLGFVGSTPALAYQAAFENERRWITWDLLSGRVDRQHPLRAFLEHHGATAAELDHLVDDPCPPDIVGINHYVTSNRFLDERAERFPPHCRGGNGRDSYADLETVRVPDAPFVRVSDLLREAWERYRLPVAVTEAHIGCTRDEQLRWLQEVWSDALVARLQGADVRAVTAWALFGSFNWNSLVTEDTGHYEPGAFDVRGPAPRPTAIARLLRDLPRGEQADAELGGPGWWRRGRAAAEGASAAAKPRRRRPILIAGRGTLGRAYAAICERRGLIYRLCSRADLDIADETSIDAALAAIRPWAVVNAAGYVRVDAAEMEPARCYRENSFGPKLLAEACSRRALQMVTFSSDLVFDGGETTPYLERHAARPLNVYGASKADAERCVLRAHDQALVIRTSAFFGPWDEHNFVTLALRALAAGREFAAVTDLVVSPTYVPDLVDASLDLLIDRERGLWHLANQGSLSWAELALLAARLAGVPTTKLKRMSCAEASWGARRPAYSVLGSERGALLPPVDRALHAFVAATHGK
jgi:dTDP-4-dehydrorhamnose reductase